MAAMYLYKLYILSND